MQLRARLVDKILGARVITGDGRRWIVQSVQPSPGFGPTMVRLNYSETPGVHINLPLSTLVDALDYGLMEEV